MKKLHINHDDEYFGFRCLLIYVSIYSFSCQTFFNTSKKYPNKIQLLCLYWIALTC